MKAYYIYRPHPYFKEFYPGKILDVISDTGIVCKYLEDSRHQKLAQKYFPEGLTPHGLSMLISRDVHSINFTEPVIEFIFELVRQHHFPHAPSRLTSLYGIATVEQANQWRCLFSKNFEHMPEQTAQSLWEIAYDTEAATYDASLLNVDPHQVLENEFSCFLTMDNAFRYWSGEMTKDALPELLIPPPVTVIQQIAW